MCSGSVPASARRSALTVGGDCVDGRDALGAGAPGQEPPVDCRRQHRDPAAHAAGDDVPEGDLAPDLFAGNQPQQIEADRAEQQADRERD